MLINTIIVALLAIWLLGFTVFHMGAIVHLLLIVALVLVIKRLLQERKSRYNSQKYN